MVGTTLSHFKITAKLGEGGMGEVYRADDTKLGREVAIKVLPEAVASDPERLARFEREAKVLASLNHPNIAAIYSLESATAGTEGVREGLAPSREGARPSPTSFLVMELAEGEDLSERITRGPIPIAEALPIARQITEAFEAAHERGIIHRDLKPANIKVDREDQVKVLDFGLAKALDLTASEGEQDPAGTEAGRFNLSVSPTLTAQMTQAGIILGTAAYMSPEQAKGRPVDKRTDIWAFGVVIFEMLTGRRLFEAESVPETLGAIFQQGIDLDELPADTPRSLKRLLERCLDRDPKSRLRDIGEARLAIQATMDGDISEPTDAPSTPATKGASVLLVAATLVAGLFLGSLLAWQLRPAEETQVLKLEVPTDNLSATRVQQPLISPDGRKVLIPEARGLVIRSLDAMTGRSIPDSTAARFPCWSPDSQSIAFVIGVEIRKASIEGGAPIPVANLPSDVGGSGGMVWTKDGHLLVAGGDRSGIIQVSVQGGDFEEVAPLDGDLEVDFHELTLLPNQQDLVYTLHRRDPAGQHRLVDRIGVFKDGARQEVLRLDGESIVSVAYSPPGFLLYHQSTGTPGVWALPFSHEESNATGDPFLVVADSWLPSASDDGTLLVVHGMTESLTEIVELDREGNLLRTVTEIQSQGESPHLSPDGNRLILSASEAGNWDIWVYDLERETRARLTFDSTFEAGGRWSPNSEEILYASADVRQLKVRSVDGTGEARIVGHGLSPDWIPDGSGFAFEHFSDETDSWDISYRLFSDEEATPILATPANETSPKLSPDGRHLLYVSDESGKREVLARSFPDGARRWQVSTAGGMQPQWSPDGLEIFYVEGTSLMAVEVADPDTFTLGRPTPILEGNLSLSIFDAVRFNSFAVGPGGRSFFMVRSIRNADTPNRLMLIQNWHLEFGGRK